MSFHNKIVIITGASSGIGAAAALLFATKRANVVLVGRNYEKLQNVLKECEQNGKKNIIIQADVSKEDDAKRIIKITIDTFGKLDVLVNNAGIIRFANVVDENIMQIYDEIMNTNIRASVYLTHLSAQHLIKTKGNIVNVSSIAGSSLLSPAISCYGISKAALNHFTRAVAAEFASCGVRVNAVSPGPVNTDLIRNAGVNTSIDESTVITTLGRVSQSQEIANLILYLASDKALGITGSEFLCDNGSKLKYLYGNWSFANKVVIVTGAGSGIGAATANLFAKEGANVVLVGRSESKLNNVLKQCEENGKKHLIVTADVSKEYDVKKIIKNTVNIFGKLDVLVNNAGIVRFASLLDEKALDVFDEIMNTNLRAPVYLTNLAAPLLIKSKGNVVNVSSISSGKVTAPVMNYYGISKAALNRFTEGIAVELAPHGVRVNSISPGPVKTDIMANSGAALPFDPSQLKIPLGKVSEASEVADLILFLASEKAKSITGSDFVADNGMRIKF